MANLILASQENSRYQLAASARRSILSAAPFPGGKIHPAALQRIAQQRADFVAIHGSDGVELTYCLPESDRQKILEWAKKEHEFGEKNVKFDDI